MSPSKDSIFCSSFLVPRVVATRAWVSPRVKRADRKSTRLNSSHVEISYAVFCLKKKIMYDLNSHYIEGKTEEITKAKYCYSPYQRFFFKRVVIALVITP